MTDNYNFEAYHDWRYLADYFNITVTDEEITQTKEQLEQKDLLIKEDDNFTDKNIKHTTITPVLECDVKSEIRRKKLKKMIQKTAFRKIQHDREANQYDINAIRHFVETLAKKSFAESCVFWEAISEIDNDYIFLKSTAENIGDLWF